MRRLRAGLVTPLPGGLGSRSGGIRTAPRGARWTGTGLKCLVPGNADPGTEIAAMERRVAHPTNPRLRGVSALGEGRTRRAGVDLLDAPRGAPSPRLSRGW